MSYQDPWGYDAGPQFKEETWLDNPLINNFATRGLLSGVQFISDTLTKPKNALFGLAKGDLAQVANLIPFSDTLGITNTGDPNKGLTAQAVDGRDLLRHYGLADQEDTWGNFAAGTALDIALDPLAWIRGPLGALTKAGEAAQKSVGLQKSLIGRMKPPIPLEPQGGLFSITNKPWYMEMLPGAKAAENVYVAGVDPFLKKPFQNIAQSMDTGWSKATRWNIPGTDFSPVAWLRSAYEKGAGNMSGYAPIVDQQAKTLVDDTKAFSAAAREAAYPIHELTSAAQEKLVATGLDPNTAQLLLAKAGGTRRELGATRIPEGAVNENAVKILSDYGEAFAKHAEPIYGKEALADLKAHGVQIDDTKNIWGEEYVHRQQAGMGDHYKSQQMGREDILKEVPGGTDTIEKFATHPMSGAASWEKDPTKLAAMKEAYVRDIEKEIHKEGSANIQKNYDRFRYIGQRISDRFDPKMVRTVPGQVITDEKDQLIKELERGWGLQPRDKIGPEMRANANAPDRWSGKHRVGPARGVEATEADIRAMADFNAAHRAWDIVANPDERRKLAEKLADHFMHANPEIRDRGYYFHKDLGTGAQSYGEHMASQKAMNISIMDVLTNEAKPTAALRSSAAKHGDVLTLKEAIDELGMQGAEEMILGKASAKHSIKSVEELENIAVPKKLVDKLKLEKAGLANSPEGWISKLTNATRYGLTVLWPANLTRNWTGEAANVAVSGQNPLKGLADSVSYFNKTLTDPAKLAEAAAANKAGIVHGALGIDQNKTLLGTGVTKEGGLAVNVNPKQVARTTGQVAKDFIAPVYSKEARDALGITPFAELMGYSKPSQPVTGAIDATVAGGTVAPPTTGSKVKQWLVEQAGKVIDPIRGYAGAMETAQHFQNNVARHQQIKALKAAGYSDQAAAEQVLKTQRDYTNLTPFEQRFMRNVAPFYSFSKQNLISQADMLSRNTGRYSALMTLLNSGRGSGGFVPGYASSGAAIPLPWAEDGQQRFLGSLGLTQEDEMMSALASLAGFRGREAVRKFASGSNPALKVPFEIATGTQVFSGRKLDDLNPSSIATLLTLGQSPDAARMLSSVMSGTPAARVFSTVDRLADIERRGPIATLLNLGTGLRTVDVDTKAAAQIAARDTITKMLNASDQYKLREQLVVDPKWKESGQEMPPEIAELFRQYELLQQEGKKAVKEKQAAGR